MGSQYDLQRIEAKHSPRAPRSPALLRDPAVKQLQLKDRLRLVKLLVKYQHLPFFILSGSTYQEKPRARLITKTQSSEISINVEHGKSLDPTCTPCVSPSPSASPPTSPPTSPSKNPGTQLQTLHASKSFCDFVGESAEELIGKECRFVRSKDDCHDEVDGFGAVLALESAEALYTVVDLIKADGLTEQVSCSVRSLFNKRLAKAQLFVCVINLGASASTSSPYPGRTSSCSSSISSFSPDIPRHLPTNSAQHTPPTPQTPSSPTTTSSKFLRNTRYSISTSASKVQDLRSRTLTFTSTSENSSSRSLQVPNADYVSLKQVQCALVKDTIAEELFWHDSAGGMTRSVSTSTCKYEKASVNGSEDTAQTEASAQVRPKKIHRMRRGFSMIQNWICNSPLKP